MAHSGHSSGTLSDCSPSTMGITILLLLSVRLRHTFQSKLVMKS